MLPLHKGHELEGCGRARWTSPTINQGPVQSKGVIQYSLSLCRAGSPLRAENHVLHRTSQALGAARLNIVILACFLPIAPTDCGPHSVRLFFSTMEGSSFDFTDWFKPPLIGLISTELPWLNRRYT